MAFILRSQISREFGALDDNVRGPSQSDLVADGRTSGHSGPDQHASSVHRSWQWEP
jgi:hypothetical protein